MPIYEYECDGCHSVFEIRQKVSDPAPTQHSCGSTQVRRILSATSFVLKGTGWYATDYGNRSQGENDKEGKKKDGGNAANSSAQDASAPSADAPASSQQAATEKPAAKPAPKTAPGKTASPKSS